MVTHNYYLIIYCTNFTLLLCTVKKSQCCDKQEYEQPVLQPHLKLDDPNLQVTAVN